MKVTVAPRPYLIRFPSGKTFPLTSKDVERLVREYTITHMSPMRLWLTVADGRETLIWPATLGGGPAFTKVRGQ